MRGPRLIQVSAAAAVLIASARLPAEGPVNGPAELYWVPTLEQGLAMAGATGRPLFLMGYSLVGNGTTYTRIAEDYCSSVF